MLNEKRLTISSEREVYFDAVADFDAATLDPATSAMKAPMQPNDTTAGSGELLHPNRVGYQAMAETIDIKTLGPRPSE